MRITVILSTIFASAGAPLTWIAQMSASEIVTVHVCYPDKMPLNAPTWAGLPDLLIWINLLSVAGGLLCGFLALQSRQHAMHPAPRENKASVDDTAHRTQFLAKLYLLSNAIFISAILFTCCAALLVSPCSV